MGPLFFWSESVAAIGAAIELAELDKIRDAYVQLGQRVAVINAGQLSGDMAGQLQEFTMLLRNDSVEGKEITGLQNADRIYLLTKRHTERLQAMFGLLAFVKRMVITRNHGR